MAARLDIQSDSSDLLKTAVDLDRVAQAAVEAGGRIDKLAASTESAAAAAIGQSRATVDATSTISAEVAAIERAFQAQNRFVQSTREQAIATRQATAELHTMRFGVANVAAQFQDIAVTSQMGMNPWVIALQQGTQLSQVFGGQGLTGVMRTLGSAVASVFSPVSLLTIAFVGLASWGIQALMSIMNTEEDVKDSLKEHNEWLQKILEGYEAAGQAAEDAAASAMKLPQAVVESGLEKKIGDIVDQIDDKLGGLSTQFKSQLEFIAQMRDVSENMGGTGEEWTQAENAIRAMTDLGLTTESTTGEIRAAQDAVRAFMETTEDDSLKAMAADVLALLDTLVGLRAETMSTAAALASLQNAATLDGISKATDTAVSAIKRLQSMAPELRSTREIAKDELNTALASSPDAILRQQAQSQYEKTVSAMDEIDRRREAERAARTARSGGARSARSAATAGVKWDNDQEKVERDIEQMRLEQRLLGATTREAATLRKEMELLNSAKTRGQEVTPELSRSVRELADSYGVAAEELENAKKRQQEWDDQIDFARELTGNLLIDTKNNLKETGDLWGSVADAAETALDRVTDRLLQMANDAIWEMLAGQMTGLFGGGGGGGGIGGMISSLFGGGGPTGGAMGNGLWGSAIFANAKGGVYASSSLGSMSNTIQDKPTLFPFAKGVGLLGEDPGSPGEAIMPLSRGPDGSLGVRASGGSGGGLQVNMTVIEGASENRSEASRNGDQIDIRVWLMAQVTKDASTRGTALNNIIRSGGGSGLTGR